MGVIFNYWFVDLIAVFFVIFTAIYLYMQNKYNYWRKKNVRYIEPKFPFGNIGELITQKLSVGEQFEKLYYHFVGHKYGGFYQIHKPALMVRDPELIKNILIKSFAHFHDHGFYFDEETDPLSANLLFLSGTKWRNLRTTLSPTFTSGKMKMMFEMLMTCGEELQNYLRRTVSEGEKVIEFKDLLSRYSIDIIASCAFGLQSNCLKDPDAEFRVWGKKIITGNIKTSIRDALSFCAPSIAAWFKIPFTPKDITRYFIAVVKETIEYRENNNVSRNDFMQLLIQLKNKGYVEPDKISTTGTQDEEISGDNKKLSLKEVAAQALVFFIGGFETSATTMTFCLYELANNTAIQDRLRNEIQGVLKKYNGKVTYESIAELKYLDKVVSETLRLHPPIPILNRTCDKDYTIEETGDFIEKGTAIVISTRGMHRDPKYFPNPETFNPENFSESAVEGRASYVYLPFGEGPRICIGQRFGLMTVKVGLISVLRENEVHLSSKTKVPLELDKKSFFTSPARGMFLKILPVQ